jgi:hypothetical protein
MRIRDGAEEAVVFTEAIYDVMADVGAAQHNQRGGRVITNEVVVWDDSIRPDQDSGLTGSCVDSTQDRKLRREFSWCAKSLSHLIRTSGDVPANLGRKQTDRCPEFLE